MSSVRQQIVDAIEARFKTIVTPTYATQIGTKVYPWRKTPVQVAETPCICFWDSSAEVSFDGIAIGRRQHILQVEAVCFVSTKTTVSQARAIIEDMIAALGTDDTFGGLADRSELTSHEIGMEVDGDICGAGKITFTVQYTTTLWHS